MGTPTSPRPITARWTPDDYRQRPRDYDPSLADDIVDRIANGEMLPVICNDRDMPLPGTFLRWVDEDPSLEERYLKARRYGTDVNLDEAVVAAHNSDPGLAGARSRSLMWHVERSMPEKYGPKSAMRITEGKEKDVGGIDYAAEVRRKLDAMARRRRARRESQSPGAAEGEGGSPAAP